MDRTGADFDNAVSDMRNKLGAYAYPISLPLGAEDQLKGVIDVVSQKAIIYDEGDPSGLKYEVTGVPADHKERAEAAYRELLEAVADKDDAVMELVVNELPIDSVTLKAAIRRLTCSMELVPVLGGSAFKNKGVHAVVDAVVDYLPSPVDVPSAVGTDLDQCRPQRERRQVKASNLRRHQQQRELPCF